MGCPARCSDDPRSAKVDDSPDGALWHCKRCDKSGSIVDFYSHLKDLTLADAISEAERVMAMGVAPKLRLEIPKRDVADLWLRMAETDGPGQAYLEKRGVPPDGVRFNVGKTGDSWLDKKASQGYRVAVPLVNSIGTLVSIQLRCVLDGVKPSKLNLPGISTSGTAFGSSFGTPEVNICEGMMDTLAVRAVHPDTIGSPGADQLSHLLSMVGDPTSRRFTLWPQNDAKSRESFALVASALRDAGAEVKVMQTPASFKDPAEWHLKDPGLHPVLVAPSLSVIQGGAQQEASAALDLGSQEPLTNSYASMCRVLRTPPMRRLLMGRDGEFAFNEMTLMPTFAGEELQDHAMSAIREMAEQRFKAGPKKGGLKFSRQDVSDAVIQIAREQPYHPVRQYLDGLRWDGTPRLDAVSETYLGAAPTPLARVMLRRWFISAVARAMEPGCKVDTVLVLVGPQGRQKSSFFRVLAGGPWFSDSSMTLGDKDSYLNLHAAWIYEWAELESMQRARDVGTVKAFVSSQDDTFRPPYGRATSKFLRSCVIVGTTNDEEFLTDSTGNRRYWPVTVSERILLDLLAEHRDQLWAEAVYAYRQKEKWWLDEDEDRSLSDTHEIHVVSDTWDDELRRFLLGYEGRMVTTNVILSDCLKKPVERWTRADQMRVAASLTRLGWERQRVRGSGSVRVYNWTPGPKWRGEVQLEIDRSEPF